MANNVRSVKRGVSAAKKLLASSPARVDPAGDDTDRGEVSGSAIMFALSQSLSRAKVAKSRGEKSNAKKQNDINLNALICVTFTMAMFAARLDIYFTVYLHLCSCQIAESS